MATGFKKLTEAAFTRQVLDLAKVLGWRRAHFRAARTNEGWRTPVSGDGAGFPDLILIRGKKIIVAELKVGKNKPTEEQLIWLNAFYGANVLAVVWRPEDWDQIVATLRGS